MGRTAFRVIGAGRADEWVARGHRRRHFFAHRLFHLPKCAPDGDRLAKAMCGRKALNAHWQLLLYADETLTERFPRDLFFDDDLIWHQQQLERPGQVATAAMILDGDVLHLTNQHSDLVQRIGRVPEHATQIRHRFRGWPWMVLNGVLAFAREHGVATVLVPSSRLAMRHTDTARTVKPDLFERVYDQPLSEIPSARRSGEWWEIDVARSRRAVLDPTLGAEPLPEAKVVCLFHDLERGLGHLDEDPELARRADAEADARLTAMLEIEKQAGVRVTYNVVGCLLHEVRAAIEAGGHAVAFHSYDHSAELRQLDRCRELDYRLKGYRLPKSRHTPETTDEQLAFHNFEWLASSPQSLGSEAPELRNRLVRLPVACDDFPLYTGELSYERWQDEVLARVERAPYTAVGLHDCYAHLWLPRYPELLDRLSALATIRTFDQMSAETILKAAA